MRLQLIAIAALVAAPAAADPGGEATVRVYGDDDGMTVVSPSGRIQADAGAIALDADVAADVISGASIDVMTSASPRPIDERRIEAGLAATRGVGAGWLRLGAAARGSYERDHEAARAALLVRDELDHRRVTVDARYTAGVDAIGTVDDPAFERRRTLHEVTAGVTVVTDPRTLIDVVVDGTRTAGYHASPYRRVPLVEPGLPAPMWLAERVPARRYAIAASARVRRAIGDAWFASLTYRAYADDWAIASHTAAADLRRQLGDRVLAGVTVRGYLQDGARFYRASYVDDGEVPDLRTRDRTLGPTRTMFASLTADVALDDDARWHAIAAAGALAEWFPEFPLQRERHAVMLTLSLAMPFGGDDP